MVSAKPGEVDFWQNRSVLNLLFIKIDANVGYLQRALT